MFEHVLVPLDGSPLAESVLPHALEMARAFAAKTTLLQVVEQGSTAPASAAVDPLDWHLKKAEAEAYLHDVVQRIGEPELGLTCECVEGQAAERILDFAHRHGVDLIALCSHGRSGLSGWNVSSVVQKIILRAHVSTLLVRAYHERPAFQPPLRYRRMVVTLDGSQRAECGLPLATQIARFHGADLLLTHVIRRPEMPRRSPLEALDRELAERVVERNRQDATQYLDHLQARLAADLGDTQHRLLVHESAAAALHDLVEEEGAELVVMSAHGYSGSNRWPYGSVAVSFIVYGHTPLLIVQDLAPDEVGHGPAERAILEHKGH